MQPSQLPKERVPGDVIFHPLKPDEYNLPNQFASQAQTFGFRPIHKQYHCGTCGSSTNGRVLCDLVRETDQSIVSWCHCSCERQEPAILIERDGEISEQIPMTKEFNVGKNWPTTLADLYEEAAKAYSAGAYTATSMVCRKLLMVCACDNGAKEDEKFVAYVNHITTQVLSFPKAKAAIDAIRDIGNEANHDLKFVAPADAKRALEIITYMLNTIYSLPSS